MKVHTGWVEVLKYLNEVLTGYCRCLGRSNDPIDSWDEYFFLLKYFSLNCRVYFLVIIPVCIEFL